MTTDAHLAALAAAHDVRIEYGELPADRDGEYRWKQNVICLRPGMTARLHRSVLAHELAHAIAGDRPSRRRAVFLKQEQRAEEWAAMQLISLEAYRRAECIHDGHAGAMAVELGVVRSIVDAYRAQLLRIEVEPIDEPDLVYVDPRMGVGNWAHREQVAP